MSDKEIRDYIDTVKEARDYISRVLEKVRKRDKDEPEFLQTVEEVLGSIGPVFEKHPEYMEQNLLERFCEPER
ncbi:hypothetical protein F3O63_04500, partial [Clostridium sp. HV4-5-A1G]